MSAGSGDADGTDGDASERRAELAELLVICGPTAAGKSALALALAERAPVTIISADSRQIYRGFDVGTAKPSPDERAAVPHDCMDVVEPTVRYSAAAWAADASRAIEAAIAAGRRPVIVGGTGLYLRALFGGLFDEPPLDAVQRAAIADVLATMPVGELERWVRELDPSRAHLGRTQHLRSIEIALLTGRRLSLLHRERQREARWRARYLVVDSGPALADDIGRRIDAMFDHGWTDEVTRLMTTVPEDAPAWLATGYDTVRRLVAGELTPGAAREHILIRTRQYAKRQRTWFRHQLPAARVTHLDPRGAGAVETAAYALMNI